MSGINIQEIGRKVAGSFHDTRDIASNIKDAALERIKSRRATPLPEPEEEKPRRFYGHKVHVTNIPSDDPCFKLFTKQNRWRSANTNFHSQVLVNGWQVDGGQWHETPSNPNQKGTYAVINNQESINYVVHADGTVDIYHQENGATKSTKNHTDFLITRVGEVVKQRDEKGKEKEVFYCYEAILPQNP